MASDLGHLKKLRQNCDVDIIEKAPRRAATVLINCQFCLVGNTSYLYLATKAITATIDNDPGRCLTFDIFSAVFCSS